MIGRVSGGIVHQAVMAVGAVSRALASVGIVSSAILGIGVPAMLEIVGSVGPEAEVSVPPEVEVSVLQGVEATVPQGVGATVGHEMVVPVGQEMVASAGLGMGAGMVPVVRIEGFGMTVEDPAVRIVAASPGMAVVAASQGGSPVVAPGMTTGLALEMIARPAKMIAHPGEMIDSVSPGSPVSMTGTPVIGRPVAQVIAGHTAVVSVLGRIVVSPTVAMADRVSLEAAGLLGPAGAVSVTPEVASGATRVGSVPRAAVVSPDLGSAGKTEGTARIVGFARIVAASPGMIVVVAGRGGCPVVAPEAMTASLGGMIVHPGGMTAQLGGMVVLSGEMIADLGEMIADLGEMVVSVDAMIGSPDAMIATLDEMTTSAGAGMTAQEMMGSAPIPAVMRVKAPPAWNPCRTNPPLPTFQMM